MKILKAILDVLKVVGTFLLVIFSLKWIEKIFKKENSQEKDKREKIKQNMKTGASKFGRPLMLLLMVAVLLVTQISAQYTNINYSEKVNWNWYSKDSYIGYCQFYITNCHKLINSYKKEQPSWLERMWEKYDLFFGFTVGVLVTIVIIK